MPEQYYTVIGYYEDNKQPWISFERAESPQFAAALALRTMLDLNEWGPEQMNDINVVEVIEGHHHGLLENDNVLCGSELVEIIGKKRWVPRAKPEDK